MAGQFGTLGRLKSDPESTAATLEAVALDYVGVPDPALAAEAFAAAVWSNPVLVKQLFANNRDFVESEAKAWLADFIKRSPKGEGAASANLPLGQTRSAAPEQISAEANLVKPQGQTARAESAEPINGGGHRSGAVKAIPPVPPSVDPKSSGGGQRLVADKAERRVPLPARRQIVDINSYGRNFAAEETGDLFKKVMSCGRQLGKIRWCDLQGLYDQCIASGREQIKEALIYRRLLRGAKPYDDTLTIEECYTLKTVETASEEAIARAEAVINVA